MKAKLVKLSEEHYIIVDDSEIKKDDFCIYKTKEIIQYLVELNTDNLKKITHSTQPLEVVAIRFRKPNPDREVKGFDKIKELKLSEIEELIYGYSVKKLSEEKSKYSEDDWISGFEAHQELTKDKVFTLDQINRLVNSVTEFMSHNEPSEFDDWYQKKLQKFLPKTEWDIEIDEQGKITLI